VRGIENNRTWGSKKSGVEKVLKYYNLGNARKECWHNPSILRARSQRYGRKRITQGWRCAESRRGRKKKIPQPVQKANEVRNDKFWSWHEIAGVARSHAPTWRVKKGIQTEVCATGVK
jgi:hypothetical protein